ncbi:uncharacterized protein LOC110030315 [Phalaenopsis equestris]|uniref:uncharacterized protein LOC110030315 n=1 Tax=Phalaenopsis equestris TaxID=78828 RepID=UPI0009E520AB|nr:uncharacterized protein LOC110030315 [Phalaenopsis equestris]
MSAGVCGKRLGFEEIFGSPSSAPSAKRSRCSSYGSPIRLSEFGFAVEDKVSVLLRMFPSMDREVVETVLNSHDHKIDDAIKSLHALCLRDNSIRGEPVIGSSEFESKENGIEGVKDAQIPELNGEVIHNVESDSKSREIHGSSWVDVLVQEMMNASDLSDVRCRTMKILESFEQMVVAHSNASKEQEIASLKEQLQCLLRDNQILRRAVAIQHERNLELEEKAKEVQQLKNIISQYQEQLQTLELNNYTLKIHLQRAQEANSIPGRFHPDIF